MSVSIPAAWRGTHSRLTNQRALKASGSRRFSFDRCRPLIAVSCGVVSAGLLVNGYQSQITHHYLSMILFGVSSLPFGALCGGFLAAPEKPSNPAPDITEAEREHWRKVSFRCAFLREEIKRRKANHQAYGDLQDELKGHVQTILAGRG